MLKAVLFDIDGVLLDSFEANLKFFHDLMEMNHFSPPTREQYRTMFHLPMVDVIRKVTGLTDEQEIQRLYTMGKQRVVPYPFELLKVPEAAEMVVAELSQTYPLGLVTSRIKDHVFKIPQLAKLKSYFQVLVAVDDVTHPKPNPEPLLLATSKLNVDPHLTTYIGDAETDFIAARAAGTKIIMFNNHQLSGADGYASTFEEIKEAIRQLN